jgi:hypothetical protein
MTEIAELATGESECEALDRLTENDAVAPLLAGATPPCRARRSRLAGGGAGAGHCGLFVPNMNRAGFVARRDQRYVIRNSSSCDKIQLRCRFAALIISCFHGKRPYWNQRLSDA